MQKKVSNPQAERAKKFLKSRPLEGRKTPCWNVGQAFHSSKVIYYIVLYSINIVLGIISSSHYWKK